MDNAAPAFVAGCPAGAATAIRRQCAASSCRCAGGGRSASRATTLLPGAAARLRRPQQRVLPPIHPRRPRPRQQRARHALTDVTASDDASRSRSSSSSDEVFAQLAETRQRLDALQAENARLRARQEPGDEAERGASDDVSIDRDRWAVEEQQEEEEKEPQRMPAKFGCHGDNAKFVPAYTVDVDEVLARVIPVVTAPPSSSSSSSSLSSAAVDGESSEPEQRQQRLAQLDAAIELAYAARDSLHPASIYADAVRGRFLLFSVSPSPVQGVQRVALPCSIELVKRASAPFAVLMRAAEIGIPVGDSADADHGHEEIGATNYAGGARGGDVQCLVVVEADLNDAAAAARERQREEAAAAAGVEAEEAAEAEEDAAGAWTDTDDIESQRKIPLKRDIYAPPSVGDAAGGERGEVDENGFAPGKFYLWLVRDTRELVVRWYDKAPTPELDGVECIGRVLLAVVPSVHRASSVRPRRSGFLETDQVY